MPRVKSPCGTPAALRRHIRLGEAVDDACAAVASDPALPQPAPPRPVVHVPPVAAAGAQVDRADILRANLDVIAATLNVLDPDKIAPLLRERRETIRELESLTGSAKEKSLAEQIADALGDG